MDKLISLAGAFITIQDPRIDRTKKHNLVDILMITLCATICGVEGWEEIEIFAEEREDWFKGFLELPNGIPSHDIPLKQWRKGMVELKHGFVHALMLQESLNM